MLRQRSIFAPLVFAALAALGFQSTSQAQTVGGMFKIRPADGLASSVSVNAWIDEQGKPAGSFFITNSTWNFSGGYQYTALGTNLSFVRDLRKTPYAATGYCYGTLYNFFYVGSRTKVMAQTTFATMLGINNFAVTLTDFTTHKPIVTYNGVGGVGFLSLTN